MSKTAEEKVIEARRILRDPFSEYTDLSPRERKALGLLARGSSSRTLAHELGITVRTAYNVIDRALIKVSTVEKKLVSRDDVTGMVFGKLKSTLNGGPKR